ncbi:hypothetical protein BGZ83_004172 [Gryganskiella cystojenkinii]|nr:hypothetical protein BGZ83_004172 [Gryganskiella cystojenkinii]
MLANKTFTHLFFLIMTILVMVMSANAAIASDSTACRMCTEPPECPPCPFGWHCTFRPCTCLGICVAGAGL